MLNAGFGRSVLGKSVPEVLSQGPTVHKTESTVFNFFCLPRGFESNFFAEFKLSHSVQIWRTRAFHISTQKDVGTHS